MYKLYYFVVYNIKLADFVKSRHTREGWYLETLQLLKRTGFPIKDFGTNGFKRAFFYETSKLY